MTFFFFFSLSLSYFVLILFVGSYPLIGNRNYTMDLTREQKQHLFRQNTYLRNKKHTLTCQVGTGYYKAVNYQPGS